MTIPHDRRKTSLVLAGSGIKFLSHLTVETKTHIEQSDKILFLVNDPAFKEWIPRLNNNCESLDDIYFSKTTRDESYISITNYILENVRKMQHVCVIFYGHPCVYAKPGLDAAKQAKSEGYFTKILPGISAEACLFADLFIDPGTTGYHSFEATDFLLHKRQFDNSCHLILWQIDVIGLQKISHEKNNPGIILLTNNLLNYYDKNHQIIIYEAALYPGFEPKILNLKLKDLPFTPLTPLSTLCIPPTNKKNATIDIMTQLKIKC